MVFKSSAQHFFHVLLAKKCDVTLQMLHKSDSNISRKVLHKLLIDQRVASIEKPTTAEAKDDTYMQAGKGTCLLG